MTIFLNLASLLNSMKKRRFVLFLLFIGIVALLPFISALELRDVIDKSIKGMQDVAIPVFGAAFGAGSVDFFFAKLLLFILLFVVIRTVLKSVPKLGENKNVAMIIALVISILAVRFISQNDLTEGVLLPTGTLGIAIITILPIIIFFFFIHNSGITGSVRKFAWIFFLVVYIGLGITRINVSSDAFWIYLVGIGIIIFAFLFDKQIKGYFKIAEHETAMQAMNDAQRVQLLTAYHKALDAYNSTGDDSSLWEV